MSLVCIYINVCITCLYNLTYIIARIKYNVFKSTIYRFNFCMGWGIVPRYTIPHIPHIIGRVSATINPIFQRWQVIIHTWHRVKHAAVATNCPFIAFCISEPLLSRPFNFISWYGHTISSIKNETKCCDLPLSLMKNLCLHDMYRTNNTVSAKGDTNC